MCKLIVRVAACIGLVLSVSTTADADTVFNLNHEFSGATAPAGVAPWIRATFSGTGGNVTLTMTALALTADEHVKEWYFNFNPSKVAAAGGSALPGLVFSHVSGPGPVSPTKDVDDLKADGDGKYDFLFAFGNGNFVPGSTSVYTIAMTGLDESDFNFQSVPDGGHGPFRSAAHVGGIGLDAEDSGWIAPDVVPVPLPAAAWMGIPLLGGVGGVGYFRRRQQSAFV